jgi:hypothetical protein
MPHPNDAELTELYTTETNVDVENDEPNAGGISATYDLRLQAVAGDNIGDSGTTYTLLINCIDESLAEPAPAGMSPGSLPQAFDAVNDWVRANDNFVKEQRFEITVPAGVGGHLFRYVATMVSDNGDVVSFIESNQFALVEP